MNVKKSLMIATVATVALAGLTFASPALANGSAQGSHHEKDEKTRPVLTVEHKEAHIAAKQAKLAEALTKAITAGKLTEVQKVHITDVTTQIEVKVLAGDKVGAKLLKKELWAWLKTEKIDKSIFPGNRWHKDRHNHHEDDKSHREHHKNK